MSALTPSFQTKEGWGRLCRSCLRDAPSALITSFSRVLSSYTRVPHTIYNDLSRRPWGTAKDPN